MIVHDAEIRILNDLKVLFDKNPAHRCLFLRLSQAEIEKEKWLPVLAKILKDGFFEEVSQIYICHDHDVFITGRSWSNKRLQEFLNLLSAKLSQASFLGLASLFEVGPHWPQLKNLCEKKIEK